MNRKFVRALSLIKNRQGRELYYRLLERVPHWLFRYNSFYIVYCDKLVNNPSFRPLPENSHLIIEPFNYALLERIKRELPQDLDSVHYRIAGREEKTQVIYIEIDGQLVATSFVLIDHVVPSPSGYTLDMGDSLVASVYGLYISSRYRLRGLLFHIHKAAYEISCEAGIPGLYGEIHFGNKNSITSNHRLGFKIIDNVRYVQFLGKKFFYHCQPETSDLQ